MGLVESRILLDTKSTKVPTLFSTSMKNKYEQSRCIFWRFPVLKLILRPWITNVCPVCMAFTSREQWVKTVWTFHLSASHVLNKTFLALFLWCLALKPKKLIRISPTQCDNSPMMKTIHWTTVDWWISYVTSFLPF